jgi:hypothetical protein
MFTSHWVSYESLYEPWCSCLSLIGRSAIARTNTGVVLLGLYPGCGIYRSSNKHLACGDETNLDCCEVMAIAGDYDMAIITLDSLYSVLSCWPIPTDFLSMSYGRRADSRGTCTLVGPCLIKEWTSSHFGPRLLVGLTCVSTCHMGSLNCSTS